MFSVRRVGSPIGGTGVPGRDTRATDLPYIHAHGCKFRRALVTGRLVSKRKPSPPTSSETLAEVCAERDKLLDERTVVRTWFMASRELGGAIHQLGRAARRFIIAQRDLSELR